MTHIFFMAFLPSSVQVAIRQLSQVQKRSVLCAEDVPKTNGVCIASAGIVRESGQATLHQTAPAHSRTVLSGQLCSPTNWSVTPTVQQRDAPISGRVLSAMPCWLTTDEAAPKLIALGAAQHCASVVFAQDAFAWILYRIFMETWLYLAWWEICRGWKGLNSVL